MTIENFLSQIIKTCKINMASGSWNKNEAMRYAYLTLGAEISKSARFFFSVEGKYGEQGLSVPEMREIHEAEAGYEVTCQVSAKMLQTIFNELGIESQIVQSAFSRPYTSQGENLDIYHSYLVCVGENNKKYFMSLNSDLVNIKLNAMPEHFAIKIPYVYNGVQTYEGSEIQHDTLTPEDLLAIDAKIGYAIQVRDSLSEKDIFIYSNINDQKHTIEGRQKEPYDYLLSQLPSLDKNFINGFDNLFTSFKWSDGTPKTNFSDLTVSELRNLEWYVFIRCLSLVEDHLGVQKTTDTERFFKYFNDQKLDTEAIQKEAVNFIKENLNSRNRDSQKDPQTNPFRILCSAVDFIKCIEIMANAKSAQNLSESERTELRNKYTTFKQKISRMFLSQDTIDMYCGKKTPNNIFLVNKLLNCVTQDFECESSQTSSYLPTISTRMQTVEQAKFLKEYLRAIFKIEFPTESAFQSRIMFSTLAEINNPDTNAFLIHIKSEDGKSDEPNYSVIYDPRTNSIYLTNFLALRGRYKILSKTVNDQVNGTRKSPSITQGQNQETTPSLT